MTSNCKGQANRRDGILHPSEGIVGYKPRCLYLKLAPKGGQLGWLLSDMGKALTMGGWEASDPLSPLSRKAGVNGVASSWPKARSSWDTMDGPAESPTQSLNL